MNESYTSYILHLSTLRYGVHGAPVNRHNIGLGVG